MLDDYEGVYDILIPALIKLLHRKTCDRFIGKRIFTFKEGKVKKPDYISMAKNERFLKDLCYDPPCYV